VALDLRNIDCMKLMAEYPDKHFDLAIVDPPYGIGAGKGVGVTRGRDNQYTEKDWDTSIPTKEYWIELMRVSKNQIVWGANHFIDNMPFNVSSPCWIVWDKDGFGDQADCELAWTSFKTAVRKYKFTWNGFRKELPQERIHPTEKPFSLYKWIFTNYVNDGDKIIDTHGGSMSIACAAHDYKVNLTVCEKDTEIYKDAVKRFSNYIAQTSLF